MTESAANDPTSWMYVPADGWVPPEADTQRPSPARVYDYWLGGKDHYAVDRELGDQVTRTAPWVLDAVRANREFLIRAVDHLARLGVAQFIDIGSGLPTSPNVHEVAGSIRPCRVVYVDNDPLALPHARALLPTGGESKTLILSHDARRPHDILDDPQVLGFLDWRQPVAALFVAVLHFLTDDEAAGIVDAFWERAAPGSYAVISHASAGVNAADERTDNTRAAAAQYASGGTPIILRDADQIAQLFGSFELFTPPGLVPVNRWAVRDAAPDGPPVAGFAGVAIKT